MNIALITGITGQTGSILAEFLLEKGYEVHGLIRRSSNFNTQRIDHILDKLSLHYGELKDSVNIMKIIKKVSPTEIYHMGAQSHVLVSDELQNDTIQINTIGTLNILEAVSFLNLPCKIYNAGTSEMYGNESNGKEIVLNEESPMNPVSVYGISKLASLHLCNMYRDSRNMFIVSGILFNHESDRRGGTFVTQKIANYVAKYAKSSFKDKDDYCSLKLGNLSAKRDWGFANDYVVGIYKMMQQEKPKNYVLATGETHSVREFVELAFEHIGIYIVWTGTGLEEKGLDKETGKILVEVAPRYFRPIDINVLLGDSTRARKELNWEPKTTFKELVSIMVSDKL